uniref:DNA-directed DNA polymerase n=1 Tax=Rhabdomonas costata TaxID=118010 RepID=A0A6F8QHP5_9EUGL|nr:putative mitochondrial DNA polymerase [Rhabdomonas costata]|eukprot:RCo047120
MRGSRLKWVVRAVFRPRQISERVLSFPLSVARQIPAPVPTTQLSVTDCQIVPFAAAPEAPQPLTEMVGVVELESPEEVAEVVPFLRRLTEHNHFITVSAINFDPKRASKSAWVVGEVQAIAIHCAPEVSLFRGCSVVVINNRADIRTLLPLAPYFADQEVRKVYHNYSVCKALLGRYFLSDAYEQELPNLSELGDDWHKGFAADTLHLARLDVSNLKASEIGSLGRLLETYADMSSETGWSGLSVWNGKTVDPILRVCSEVKQLQQLFLKLEGYLVGGEVVPEFATEQRETAFQFYAKYWRPYGELLTKIEQRGMHLDVEDMQNKRVLATDTCRKLNREFWDQAFKIEAVRFDGPVDLRNSLNIQSSKQVNQLLFGPFNDPSGVISIPEENDFQVRCLDEQGQPRLAENGRTYTKSTVKITGLGIRPIKEKPSLSSDVLRVLTKKPNFHQNSRAQNHREEVLAMLETYQQRKVPQKILQGFLSPYCRLAVYSRIHPSLNLNTNTGRLSCQNPNLQNIPSLGKDQEFKIRMSFTAPPGKLLIVADYSQAELRILAHVSQCEGLRHAFLTGGDVHSHTAFSMFPHVREAVESGKVAVDADPGGGKSLVPLLKDVFPEERKRAKTLNFAVLYGQGPRRLAETWNVSFEEARDVVGKWFTGRPEVGRWKKQVVLYAQKYGCVRTVLGRAVQIKDINSQDIVRRMHAERAAVNAVAQGSAADIIMLAMIELERCSALRDLGVVMVMQVHDEIIFEVPEANATAAIPRIKEIMERPPGLEGFSVGLSVDIKAAKSWGEAK